MADNDFNLDEAVSANDKAKADRDFYLSMVYDRSAASPIAAYLAGVAGAKASQYQSKINEEEAAIEAAQTFQKRRDTMLNNLGTLLTDIDKGDINPSAAAPVLAPLMKEAGVGTLQQYDADNKTLIYQGPEGMTKQINFKGISEKDKLANEKTQADIDYTKARTAAAKEKTQADIDYAKARTKAAESQTELNKAKAANEAQGGGKGNVPSAWPAFKSGHSKVIDVFSGNNIAQEAQDINDALLVSYLEDVQNLPQTALIQGVTKQVLAEAKKRGLDVSEYDKNDTPQVTSEAESEPDVYSDNNVDSLLGLL